MESLAFIHDKDATKSWLKMMNINHYMLLEQKAGEVSVKVEQNVNLSQKRLTAIPIQFAKIEGSFNCSGNKLTSLKGVPRYIEGDFDCSYNQLSSLEGTPIEVAQRYKANNNQIEHLDFLPKKIGNLLNLKVNKLKDINFSNLIMEEGMIYLQYNPIEHILALPTYQVSSQVNWLMKEIHLDNKCAFMQEVFKHYPQINQASTFVLADEIADYIHALKEFKHLGHVMKDNVVKEGIGKFKI